MVLVTVVDGGDDEPFQKQPWDGMVPGALVVIVVVV